jgi:murein DD-endopeptidase MepM/ murein hydrolase activator NlpD
MRQSWLLSLLLVGCASTRSAQLSVEVASVAPVTAAFVAPPAQRPLSLRAVLKRFAVTGDKERKARLQGSLIPGSQWDNWRTAMSAVDAAVERRNLSSKDLTWARITLEQELESDGRLYGNFPEELTGHVRRRIASLVVQLTERKLHEKKFAPRMPDFGWPVSPVMITSVFGRRFHPIDRVYRPHQGIDLHAVMEQTISAAADGKVIAAGYNGHHGFNVKIQHTSGMTTRYSHLSELLVKNGARVERGDPIGLAGETGLATGVHLHFEMHQGGLPVDPLRHLRRPTALPMASR